MTDLALALLTYPNIDPVAIEVGPLSIKWYGIAYMTGLKDQPLHATP